MRFVRLAVALVAVLLCRLPLFSQCGGVGVNNIACENALPGNAAAEWDGGVGSSRIEGFTTDISVNKGSTIDFKIRAEGPFRLDIYRIGYYGGLGARKVATVSAPPPVLQPACLFDGTTRMVDCGNWSVSASWAVPTSVVSGVYVARAVMISDSSTSKIYFVVRDDSSTSDLLFQTSDTTWHAYNYWGGWSFYDGSPTRAYRLSYNRPFAYMRGNSSAGLSFFFSGEYPMVRFLESLGYPVTYTSGVDTDRRGNLIRNHKVFLSVGHDEYWSGQQRANVEAARAAGVHLAFFSGNEVYWKVRWENSLNGQAQRTLTCYKETLANAKIDPSPTWTGTFQDPRFSPEGGNPENALTGQLFAAVASGDIKVPSEEGRLRFWRNTPMASLAAGAIGVVTGALGYEFDRVDFDNGFQPPGTVRLSSNTLFINGQLAVNYGSGVGIGNATHALTLYRHSSGALVFGAGSVFYSFGLNDTHDNPGPVASPALRQATVNLLADMGVQPAGLPSGLVSATRTTDVTAPVSQISAPLAGAAFPLNTVITVSGTASDTGGLVGGVEVSWDGGTSWHPATGRSSWSYSFTANANRVYMLRSRAVDDSGNIETPAAGRSITVGAPTTPPSPANLTATAGNGQVTLSWSASSGAASYTVKRGTSSGGPYTAIASGVTATGFSNTGLTNGVTYYYVVTAVNAGGESLNSNQASAIPSAGLAAPTGLAATAGNGQVSLGWNAVSGATSYNVKRSTVSGGPYTAVASGITATSYVNSGLANGTTYYYVVSASNGSGEGPNSAQASAQPSAPAASLCPSCLSLWTTAAQPVQQQSSTDRTAVEVGVRFRSDVAGSIRGIRYFRGPANVGAQKADLWTNTGGLVGTANFAAPGSVGWHEVLFAQPAVIAANTYYIASVYLPQGGWAQDTGFFVNGRDSGPLHAPADSAATPNGIYAVGNAFPTSIWQQSNYWVDVLFEATQTAPNSPTGLSASAGNGQVSLSWSASSGASSYNVKRSTVNGGPHSTIAVTGATSFNDTSVANGTTYWYVVSALGASGSESANSAQVSAQPSAPQSSQGAPTGLTAVAGNQQVTLTWNAVPGASYYWVLRSTTSGGPYVHIAGNVQTNSYPNTGLPNGVTYYYVVTAQGPAGESGISNQVVATPGSSSVPAAPTALAAAGGNGQASLSWSPSAGATGYNVKISTSNGGPYSTVASNVANTGYLNTGLTNGVTYYWVVTALNGGVESGNSNQASAAPTAPVTAPPAPTGLTATAGNGQATLAWNASSGATGYNVKRGTANGGPYTTVAPNVTSTSYLNTGLTNGVTYYWVVTALNGGLESGNSNQASATPTAPVSAPPAPTGLTATASSAQVSLAWSASSGATSYNVKRGTANGGPYAVIGSSASTGFNDTGASNGTTYYYVVSALNAGLESGNSNQASATPQAQPSGCANCISLWPANPAPVAYPSKAEFFAVEVGVRFRSDVPGVIRGIRYYRGPLNPGANTAHLWSTTGTLLATGSFSAPATTGWQQVLFPAGVAINANTIHTASVFLPGGGYSQDPGYFANSVDTGVLHAPADAPGAPNGVYFADASGGFPTATWQQSNYWVDVLFEAASVQPPPNGLTANAGNGQVSLSWSAASGASSYNVKRGTVNGGPYTAIGSTGGTSFTDTAATNGTAFYYVVTAVGANGESTNSNQASATPQSPVPGAPVLSASAGNGQVSLSWSAVSGATGYNVKRSTVNGGPYSTIVSPGGTSFADTAVANGTTYYYVVTAVNSGTESGNSNQASATPNAGVSAPAAPTGLTVVRGNGQLQLAWTGVPGASSYTVKRSATSGGPYTAIASGVTTASFNNSGLTNGVIYYYVVSATSGASEGPNSGESSQAPFAPFSETFEGPPSFVSDYAYVPPSNNRVLYPIGLYSLTTSPRSVHDLFCSFGDHSTGSGNMMVANGSSTVQTVWARTLSGFAPGRTYTLSLWVASAYPTSPAQLQFRVNGSPNGIVKVAPNYGGGCPGSTAAAWQQLEVTFTAPASSVTIGVADLTTAAEGNDFALDDITVR